MADRFLYKIHITGLVQGVGFRWSAAREAKARGINGFVKNQSDGSVYIEAEGSETQLNAYVNWCKNGPGIVESVNTETFPPAGYHDFLIEH